MRDALIIVAIITLGAFWARLGWRAGIEEGRSQAQASAIHAVQADMAKHCTCWFTDRKCKTPNPTVICTKPEWMK